MRCSRESGRQSTLAELEGPWSVESHEPLVRGSKCRLDTPAHLGLFGFRRNEERAERGDIAQGDDCVVVRPPARAVVLSRSAQLGTHRGANGCRISTGVQRNRRFVNESDALRRRHSTSGRRPACRPSSLQNRAAALQALVCCPGLARGRPARRQRRAQGRPRSAQGLRCRRS